MSEFSDTRPAQLPRLRPLWDETAMHDGLRAKPDLYVFTPCRSAKESTVRFVLVTACEPEVARRYGMAKAAEVAAMSPLERFEFKAAFWHQNAMDRLHLEFELVNHELDDLSDCMDRRLAVLQDKYRVAIADVIPLGSAEIPPAASA